MKAITLLLALPLLFACSTTSVAQKPAAQSDLQQLLASLLNIQQSQYAYKDDAGNTQVDELQQFKALEALYGKYVDAEPTRESLSVVMFFAYYAQAKNNAALQEYLAEDLIGVYQKSPTLFLQTLNQLPFLIAVNCERLNASFGFAGNNKKAKPGFLQNNKSLFKKHLNADNRKTCLQQFKL